jgi:hypothetical protein
MPRNSLPLNLISRLIKTLHRTVFILLTSTRDNDNNKNLKLGHSAGRIKIRKLGAVDPAITKNAS